MTREFYLDSASGTPPHPSAQKALVETSEMFADPLRLHAAGRRSQAILEGAHNSIGESLGAQPDEIVLTSGGTESVALALRGVARAAGKPGDRILLSAVEHPAVNGAGSWFEAEGFEIVTIGVDEYGRLDLDSFVTEIRKPNTLLASVQHSNHEVGTLQPVAEAARLSREAGVLFHTDACQSVGRLPVSASALGVDLLSLSARKFGGYPGAGALYVRRGVPLAGYPYGDDRERHRRAGAQSLAGIAAMSAAIRASLSETADLAGDHWSMTGRIRDVVSAEIPGALLHGHPTQRAPHIACFSIPGVDPEVLLMALDDRGFRVGIGSVSAGLTHDASPVIAAMGTSGVYPVRVSVGRQTTMEDIDALLAQLPPLIGELRKVEAASSETLSRLNRGQQ